jgi:hypothetical protein
MSSLSDGAASMPYPTAITAILEPSLWTLNETAIEAAMSDVLAGRSGLVVLINSLPRTASKFMHGVLTAAWGARTASDLYISPFPVRHAHGLSAGRRNEFLRSDGTTKKITLESQDKISHKLRRLDATSKLVSEAKRKIVITIFRDPFDRIFSAFLLSKGSVVASEPDEKLRARFVSFLDAYATYDVHWIRDNVEEYFEVPPVPHTLDRGFSVYQRADLTYILVNISYLDNFLRQFLFSRVSEDDIGRRAL